MKKLLLLYPVLGIFLSACSNEFQIAAPFQDIPVVYGIISPNDTAHYIRIERVFIDPDASAYDVAKIPDSIYYPNNAIAVFLERVNTGQRYQMTRVNGNREGYVRQTGTFERDSNFLYKIKPSQLGGMLREGEKYRLIIERADGRPSITAETTVPDSLLLISPRPTDFEPRTIPLSGANPTSVEWRCRANAVVFDVYLHIHYRELAPDGTFLANKSIRWKAARNVIRENTLIGSGFYRGKTNISASEFYGVLLDNVDVTANVQRYFNSIDVEIEGAGPEIADYQESEAVNAGLTGAEVTTRYSNLSEGYGIFTAKKDWTIPGFRLTSAAFDSLNANNDRRVLLKFKG